MLNRIKDILQQFDHGRLGMAVRRDEPTDAGEADGELGPMTLDDAGRLRVNADLSVESVEIGTVDQGDAGTDPWLVAANPSVPASATHTNVVAANADTTLLAADATRLTFKVVNDTDKAMLLKYGASASATSYAVSVAAGVTYHDDTHWQGTVHAFWASGVSGSARVTEFKTA